MHVCMYQVIWDGTHCSKCNTQNYTATHPCINPLTYTCRYTYIQTYTDLLFFPLLLVVLNHQTYSCACMYVCIYRSVYACMYGRVRVRTYVCIVCMLAQTCACMYIYKHTHTHTLSLSQTHTHTNILICICVCCMYIYIYVYTHM